MLIPSDHARRVLVNAGLPAEKAVVSPHFLPHSLAAVAARHTDGRGPYAFVGRLTAEKGLEALLAHWPADRELVVVGDGDERARLEGAYASATVRFLGQVSRQEVVELLAAARALVFSSLWWETFGLVAMEALSAGTPVLSLGRHAVADLVREHAVGSAVDGAADLGAAVAAIEAVHPADWQAKVSTVFATEFSEDVWLRRRLHDYAAALGRQP